MGMVVCMFFSSSNPNLAPTYAVPDKTVSSLVIVYFFLPNKCPSLGQYSHCIVQKLLEISVFFCMSLL